MYVFTYWMSPSNPGFQGNERETFFLVPLQSKLSSLIHQLPVDRKLVFNQLSHSFCDTRIVITSDASYLFKVITISGNLLVMKMSATDQDNRAGSIQRANWRAPKNISRSSYPEHGQVMYTLWNLKQVRKVKWCYLLWQQDVAMHSYKHLLSHKELTLWIPVSDISDCRVTRTSFYQRSLF